MSGKVSDIRNLGPASEKEYARAGIHTAEQLRELGCDEAYRRVLKSGTRPHFIGYYALRLGLMGRHWNDIAPVEKAAFRKDFDALVAGLNAHEKGRSELEAALNVLGVVAKPDQPTSSRPAKK